MKKLLTVTLFLMLAVTSITPAASAASAAQPLYYPPQLEYYDAQIAVLEPRLEAFQETYHVVNGRYYQALQSHTAAPDVPEVPDGIDESPTDQPETLAYFWETFAALPEELSWSFRIDTYTAPDGDGYVLTVETVIDGETWTKSINYGPTSEDWRASDWYQVVPFSGF